MPNIKHITKVITVNGNPVPIISAEFNDGFRTPISKLTFSTNSASKEWLGKAVTAWFGYDGASTQVFQGYVDEVAYTRLPGVYEVTCSNDLKLAQNHYIVTSSLDEPWSRSNIAAEDLVRDLLAEAGLTNYSGATSHFTFGNRSPAEFNLMSVMDAINQINNILAYTIYMDAGTIYWAQIFPTPGTPTHTIQSVSMFTETTGTRDLRNKVVVFGKDGIYAEASSPDTPAGSGISYLPAGFYQTAIVSSELIDQQSMADQAVAYNLTLYNKLTEELRMDIEGDATIKVRETVRFIHPKLGIDSNWFVYSLRHSISNTFTTTLYLRR